MNIQEEIRYFAENLNVKFAKANSIRLRELEKRVRRYISKALRDKTLPEFTAMDLRVLVLAIGKTHRAINKSIEFTSITEKLKKKNYEVIDQKAQEELFGPKIQEYNTARELQACYSLFNYLASLLDMAETSHKYLKEKSDEMFNLAILEAIDEYKKSLNYQFDFK